MSQMSRSANDTLGCDGFSPPDLVVNRFAGQLIWSCVKGWAWIGPGTWPGD